MVEIEAGPHLKEMKMDTVKKSNIIVLWAVFLSFLALGMPDGAFGVAWPSIRYEMDLALDRAFILVVSHSVFYAVSGSQMGKLASYFKLPNVNILGLGLILIGITGFAASPNLYFLVISTMILGTGMGLVDSALNAYAAKYFVSKHMNWLHCFWGLGGALSPVIMSQMVLLIGWRMGYVSIVVIQGILTLFVVFTVIKGMWLLNAQITTEKVANTSTGKFLTKNIYAYMQIAIFFIYAGFEYALTFWTTSVMLEGRGLPIEIAGLYPAFYLGGMTFGRFALGYIADKVRNITLVRFGFLLAGLGLIILIFTNNIIGMTMIGFGFGPVFPCLMHETAVRYSPKATTKLVGYQIAAVGIGVGLSTFGMGRVLDGFSLEALFPIVLIGMIIAVIINEIIEAAARKEGIA